MDVSSFLMELVVFSPLIIWVLGKFLVNWRKASSGTEVAQLRRELEEMRRDTARLKADYNDILLGLESSLRLLEARLDRQSGIDIPAPEALSSPVLCQG